MIARCYLPTSLNFKRYGGRGITVCDRWRENFKNFLVDMGERQVGTTIDRKDNDGNYEPDNCRWLTPKLQNKGKWASTPLAERKRRMVVIRALQIKGRGLDLKTRKRREMDGKLQVRDTSQFKPGGR